jgi:hypothetical protein
LCLIVPVTEPSSSSLDLEVIRKKYEPELDKLSRDGVAKHHFVEYAPPSILLIRNQPGLQATLRNPEVFDKNTTSIYKRAARTFDLFLAPQLKDILAKIPDTAELSSIDFSVINDIAASNSNKSSEAIEFILPLKQARRFADAEITNQDLIDQSVIMVNGIRIALNLAQVE